MASNATKKKELKVDSELKEVKVEEKPAEEIASQEETSDEESEDEEIVLDEASDTENYEPPKKEKAAGDGEQDELEEDDDDDDVSSGDEEVGVHVQEVAIGETKLLKLKFDDVEEKRQEYLQQRDAEREEDSEEEEGDKENVENNAEAKGSEEGNQQQRKKFVDYRAILDTEMDDEDSDTDGYYNPMYCETLSDVEYGEDDERNTEDELEVEEQGENLKHKRTGEPLICIKMLEDLELPPDCGLAAAAASTSPNPDAQNAMECA